jgi:hypothetical protein
MAVTQFRRAERVERLRVDRNQGGAKRFDVLRDRLLVGRQTECRAGTQQTNSNQSKNGQRPSQMTTTDVHCFLRFSSRLQSW